MTTVLFEWLAYGERGTHTKGEAKAAVLNAAADLLMADQYAWGRGGFLTADGCLCIEGAIAVAANVDSIDAEDYDDPSIPKIDLIFEIVEDVHRYLGLVFTGCSPSSLHQWNDAARDLVEVEAALRGTARAVTA